jgi:hypothetical protein
VRFLARVVQGGIAAIELKGFNGKKAFLERNFAAFLERDGGVS